MEKFNRIYMLKVEVDNGVNTSPLRTEFTANKNVTITLPHTIEFEVVRRSLASSQTGTFRVYNLGLEVRNAIQKDAYQFTQLRAIQFFAGYDSPNGKFMPMVFNGTVLSAYSYREEGGTNWITEIEAFDGGWQMANANNVALSLPPNLPAALVIAQLARQLPSTSGVPIIGSYPTANLRGEVLFGNAWQLILQKSNGQAIIDNGQVKALGYNEVIQGQIPVISAESGLLGSPKRGEATLEFDMIFEPRFTVGQVVQLDSQTTRQYNRQWKIIGFTHRGTISPAISGDCLTSVQLWFTTEELRLVLGAPVI